MDYQSGSEQPHSKGSAFIVRLVSLRAMDCIVALIFRGPSVWPPQIHATDSLKSAPPLIAPIQGSATYGARKFRPEACLVQYAPLVERRTAWPLMFIATRRRAPL